MAVFTTSSTASGSIGWGSCRRQSSSSVTVTPSSSDSGISRAVSGMLAPVSHLLTALSVMWSRPASSFWVQPFSFRSWATKAPKAVLSMSYIVLTSRLS